MEKMQKLENYKKCRKIIKYFFLEIKKNKIDIIF